MFYEEPPDYSDNPAAPQQLQLVATVAGYELNLVNSVGGADRADYVRFSVPEGQRLSTFELRHYSSTDNIAFIAIQLGSSITATAQNPAPLKGYSHFGPGQVGSNLINALGGPLEAGEYSVWIQQIGAKTDYRFSLQTVTAPVPTPVLNPSYSLSAFASSVNEGSTASFTLSTSNVAAGTALSHVISGVQAADIVGGQLNGSVNVGSNGQATISIPIAADNLTEGTETMTVTVQGQSASVSILDTSTTPATPTPATNTITSINRTIKIFDASATNDTKVVVTRVGDINRIEGNQSNNTLVGSDAIDRLFGGGGSDRFYSSKGNDVLDGGDGTDAVTFRGKSTDFRVEKSGANWVVRDTRSDASVNQGENTLTSVERVAFEDKVLALDTDGVAGKAYRVYKAAFNRDPMAGDTAGLGYWIDRMDNAMDLIEVSARFVDSNEFRSLYGTNPTNDQFLTKLYTNVLGRQPEASGYNWWLNELNTNPEKTKAKVLADFAESAENQTGVVSLIGNGITYEPWVG